MSVSEIDLIIGTQSLSSKMPLLDYFCAGAVALIWATWLVASRSGAQSTLEASENKKNKIKNKK